MLLKLKTKLRNWYRLHTARCGHCNKRLRKTYNDYFGLISVNNSAGGTSKSYYEVCNLCYAVLKKLL